MSEADAKLARNERIKLTAGYLNTAASTALGAGVIAPLVAAIYGLAGTAGSVGALTLAAGATMFSVTSALLHVAARRLLGRLEA